MLRRLGRVDRAGRQPRVEIGVVARGKLIVLGVQSRLPFAGGEEDRVLHGGVRLQRHADPKPIVIDPGYGLPLIVGTSLPFHDRCERHRLGPGPAEGGQSRVPPRLPRREEALGHHLDQLRRGGPVAQRVGLGPEKPFERLHRESQDRRRGGTVPGGGDHGVGGEAKLFLRERRHLGNRQSLAHGEPGRNLVPRSQNVQHLPRRRSGLELVDTGSYRPVGAPNPRQRLEPEPIAYHAVGDERVGHGVEGGTGGDGDALVGGVGAAAREHAATRRGAVLPYFARARRASR